MAGHKNSFVIDGRYKQIECNMENNMFSMVMAILP